LDNDVKQSAGEVLLLDRALAHYGPETKDAREMIQHAVALRIAATWPEDSSQAAKIDIPGTTQGIETIEGTIRALAPQNDAQRELRSRALDLIGELEETRWLVSGGTGSSIPTPFLVVLILWFTVILTVNGLFAPRNGIVVGILFLSSLSVAASIFLILEMDQAFDGLVKVSSAPLRYTLAHLGQ
jgi:hypothetical protein